MSKMITISNLERMPTGAKACREAREWFAREFPNGATLEVAWRACPSDEWRTWFACHWLPRDERQKLAWRFAGQAFRFAAKRIPSLEKYADKVSASNWREVRAAATATAYDAAYNAVYAAYAAAYDAAIATADADADAAAYDAAAAARSEQVQWCAELMDIGDALRP